MAKNNNNNNNNNNSKKRLYHYILFNRSDQISLPSTSISTSPSLRANQTQPNPTQPQ